jgi:hypothetical protein
MAQFVSMQLGLQRVYALLTVYPLAQAVHVVERSHAEQKGTVHSNWQYPVLLLKLYPLKQEVQTEGEEQLSQNGSLHMAVQVDPLRLNWYPL